MLKNKSVLEVKANEKSYSLECYADSTLGELFDALCQMRSFVLARMTADLESDEKKIEAKVDGIQE